MGTMMVSLPPADVLGDLDEPSPVVLLEVEEEGLPVRDDLFGMERCSPSTPTLWAVVLVIAHFLLCFWCRGLSLTFFNQKKASR